MNPGVQFMVWVAAVVVVISAAAGALPSIGDQQQRTAVFLGTVLVITASAFWALIAAQRRPTSEK